MNKKIELLERLTEWMADYQNSGWADCREMPEQFYDNLCGIVTDAEEYLAEQGQ